MVKVSKSKSFLFEGVCVVQYIVGDEEHEDRIESSLRIRKLVYH